MKEQLIKKNCKTGEYNDIYPITSFDAIRDFKTGKNLNETVEELNHVFLPFKDNSKTLTRQQIPSHIRRKGLWITYISCKGNVITEWYNSDDFSNKEWGSNNNWVKYVDKSLIKSVIKEITSWYKA